MKNILDACNVCKIYGTNSSFRTQVLNNIDLSIEKGEMIGLVGPSGAGKSTLLNILAGIEQPTSGEVHFNQKVIGRDISYQNYMAQRGMVFQQFNLIEQLTALENVLWPMKILGFRGKNLDSKDCKKKAIEILSRVGLESHLLKFPTELSGGQQQRVAIARALIQSEIIFADEPTGSLDSKCSAEIEKLLHEIHEKEGATILIVTHDDGLAGRCSRIIQIKDGRVEFDTRKQKR